MDDFGKTRIINSARLANLLRFGIVALLVIVGAPSALAIGALVELNQAAILAAIVLVYTILGHLSVSANPKHLSTRPVVAVAFFQILLDTSVFTYLIHITGGITSVFTFFYAIPILMAGIMFAKYAWMAFIVAAAINIFYDSLLYLEYFKILPFPGGVPWVHEAYAGPVLVATFSLLVPLSFWGIALFAVLGSRAYQHTRDEIEKELGNEVTSLRSQLEKKLEDTNAELYLRNKELRKSEKRFEQVAANSEIWIWEVDTAGLYTYSSPTVFNILGYQPEEIVGKKYFYEFFTPDNRDKLKQTAFEFFAQKSDFKHLVNPNLHKNGSLVILETDGTPILGDNSVLIGYRGSDIDITERKQAEERLKIIFEYAPDAYYLSDLKGAFLDGNKAAEQLLGYKREELIGKNLLQAGLLSPADIPKATAMLAANIMSQPTGPDEFTLIRKDGAQLSIEISTYPVRIGNQTQVLGIARDIGRRKKAEQELKQHAEELETMNKFMVGRELDMVELKKEVNRLLTELGRAEKYTA
ncbi:MAG: PAS domain S-box protein [Candidatus Margulisbacteria bacterium]|nr:PAS domain S-box protein [Candidatus Margulisiibacteriota bacterium]